MDKSLMESSANSAKKQKMANAKCKNSMRYRSLKKWVKVLQKM